MKPGRIGFITGKLAEYALRQMLERIARDTRLEYRLIVLDITVAALMTPAWVARRLRGLEGLDSLLLPGYCLGDLAPVQEAAGIPVERGPKDLRSLPAWFRAGGGEVPREGPPEGYGAHRLEIIAEINHAPRLPYERVASIARDYRSQGADVIDIGCDPGGEWTGIGDTVRRLREEGFRLAVDTFNPVEMELAVKAGAELVLSVHGKNLPAARHLGCEVVAIPDDPRTLEGLDETIARLEEWKVPYRIDPVIEPIGFGFAASLGRYIETRRRYPQSRMLLGIGNITELTDADTAGVNAVLIGFCEELGIGSVLTTEVIPWARTAIREIDIARRLMFHAVRERVLPKHLDTGLLLLRDAEVPEHGQEVLDRLAAGIRDPSFRIFAERGEIHLINRDGYRRGKDPFELFEQAGVEDPSHAFYLGYEMAKALIALQLGKSYQQDQALRWGFLTVEETSHVDRKKNRPRRTP